MKKTRTQRTAGKVMSISALAALLLLSGCGGGGKAESESPDGKVTLNFLTQSSPLAPADPNDKLINKRLEEKTGIHINWKNYTSDVFAEKRNLAVASGDLPDAIFDAGYGDYDLLKLAKDGVIIPVEDLIDQHMPNFKKVLEQAPEYRSLITAPDGHIYSFPWIEELGSGKERIQSVDNFPWINVEWLNKLGLEMPTTTEELKEVLIAFKTQDPNGNGQADEIPLSFINKPGGEDLTFLFASFGLGENWDHTVVTDDGKVVFTAAEEGYKDAVKFVNELYEEGLIDIEAFQQDWNTYLAKGKDHRYGLYFTWDKANITGMNDAYDLMPPLAGPSGEKNVTRTNGIGLDRGRMVITSSNKHLEETAKWVDQLYEPLQSVQNNWGTYGDDTQQNIFELDEEKGMLKHLPLEGTAPVELRQKTSIAGPLAILDEYYGKYTTMPDDAAWRLKLMKDVMVPHMKAENTYPKVFFSIEELDRLSTIETDLFPYLERMRTEWYQNGKIDQEWDDYLKELDRLGLQEWLSIKQAGYDRSTK
ncbi:MULTISPECIES: ABC transporter substrate-binding protein [Paenibacillus]|uniref:Extracellular solute-binding protein family 1 n=2 Tax=Paenibacillus lactis TaxID=228574 RepID=G4HLR8_9BACL|nr:MULTISPECIES: ABC transporter substrate-binding protein [Paenibacillus]EHB56563.1 extracellular solute-binding protein family 1 [Paenibacillus lactis 154]MBP1893141.1 putative aldouronate transport system substrate-binding protein [Paenibacillus lactis]HAG01682.1 ABC transporter substrate-binding protein [Paenibacillus lactis]